MTEGVLTPMDAPQGLYTILGAPFPPPNKIATPAWV